MNFSKKQRAIIWGTVIIIVLLLGLTSSQKTYIYPNRSTYTHLSNRQVSVQLTHLFGIEVGRNLSGTDDFFYHVAKNKFSEIIIVALIGLTALITSTKR